MLGFYVARKCREHAPCFLQKAPRPPRPPASSSCLSRPPPASPALLLRPHSHDTVDSFADASTQRKTRAPISPFRGYYPLYECPVSNIPLVERSPPSQPSQPSPIGEGFPPPPFPNETPANHQPSSCGACITLLLNQPTRPHTHTLRLSVFLEPNVPRHDHHDHQHPRLQPRLQARVP